MTIDLHHLRHSSQQLCHAYRTFHLDTLPGGPASASLTDALPATSSVLPSLHTLARQLDHLGSSPVGLTALADWHLRETHCLMMALDHTSTSICHTEEDIRDVLTRSYHYYARENDHHLPIHVSDTGIGDGIYTSDGRYFPTFARCTAGSQASQGSHTNQDEWAGQIGHGEQYNPESHTNQPSPAPEMLGRPLRDVSAAFLDLDRHTFCPLIRTWQGSAATLGTLAYGIHMAATGVRLAGIPGTYTFTLGLHMHRWADSLALLAYHAEQVALRLSRFASTCLRTRTALADVAMQQRLDVAMQHCDVAAKQEHRDIAVPEMGAAEHTAGDTYTQQADAILTDIYNPGLEATALGNCGAPMPIRTLCPNGCQDAVLEWPNTPMYQPELVIPDAFALPEHERARYATLPQRSRAEHRYGDGGARDSVCDEGMTAPAPVLNPKEVFRPLEDLTASAYWMRLGNGF